jgi:cephalosporin hydroxylase
VSGTSGYGWEMEQVVREVRRAEAIVEIGTHRGGSLRVWRREFDPLILIGVDPSTAETPAGWTTPEIAAELGVEMVRLPSQALDAVQQVETLLQGRSIDLLFIDGDHEYRQVMRDWLLYTPLVGPEGVIVLDDAARVDTPADEGPQALYQHLRHEHRTKLIYDGHGGTGLAMIWP